MTGSFRMTSKEKMINNNSEECFSGTLFFDEFIQVNQYTTTFIIGGKRWLIPNGKVGDIDFCNETLEITDKDFYNRHFL